jgi:FtsZ-interacting cell division protein ZipA
MKTKVLILALILAFIAVTTLGVSKFVTTPARAQNSNTQTQAIQQDDDKEESGEAEEKAEEKEDVEEKDEAEEPANEQEEERNLPGGGHQDPEGVNVEHQFEGIE